MGIFNTQSEKFFRTKTSRNDFLFAIEVFVVTTFFAGLSFGFHPIDPFFLVSHFPWPWVVPILFALRHGSKHGLFASLLLVSFWAFYHWQIKLGKEGIPTGYFLGGFIVTLTCGEFRDIWFSQIQREVKMRSHLDFRLTALSQTYQILHTAHDQLQSNFLAHPPTIRDALGELLEVNVNQSRETAFNAFLSILSRFFQLEKAAIYGFFQNQIETKALATLGPPFQLIANDLLVKGCLESHELCHALMNDLTQKVGQYFFVAPLKTSSGEILAVLVVEKLPFFSFHQENLRALYAILGYFSDRIKSVELAAKVLLRVPDCPIDFAAEYLRLHRLSKTESLESTIGGIVLPANVFPASTFIASSGKIVKELREVGRSIDLFWIKPLKGEYLSILVLLPLCGKVQAMNFLTRIEKKILGEIRLNHSIPKNIETLTKEDPLIGLELFLTQLENLHHE